MAENIVIVESPAKSKTLKKYLGKDFEILASYGHVRDLIPQEGAVDPNNNFFMNYELIDKNKKHVDAICKALKKAKRLYLATDPDREGEAISWHLYEIVKEKGGLLDNLEVYRVAFNEITKSAVQNAIKNPRELSQELINAQQARRALDYLVGFNLSPLLWRKVKRGLSAGRVQSPALRMIAEREEAIRAFVAQEYWTIEGHLTKDSKAKDPQIVVSKLYSYKEDKIKQFSITNDKDANRVKDDIEDHAKGKLTVISVNKTQRKRNPAAPFITSTIQQEAARKLGFTSRKTMQIAQQLYEGVDIGDGAVGLITYMRTDSVNLANEAIDDIRDTIASMYGKDNLPDSPVFYKTKAKNAQEAHEAIRPTSSKILPSEIKDKIHPDQYKLYNLIWQRTVACQMIHATIDQVAVDFNAGNVAVFRATGSSIANPGFIQVYQEGVDDKTQQDGDGSEKFLPNFKEGEIVDLTAIKPLQHFTEPPPRFSEATLVKGLEEYGIGRPSTYAAIISTLQHRKYVTLENKRFIPTDIGIVVNKFLTNHFAKYVDYDFTANLEDSLDAVSRGEKDWHPLLHEFWEPFIELVRFTEKNVQRSDVTNEIIEEQCPLCAKSLSIRLGKNGRFIGCTGYPECKYTRNLTENAESAEANKPEVVADRKCPKCSSDLLQRQGKYGKFIGCSAYPKCNFIESLEKLEDTNVTCPQCNTGSLIKRKSRYGTFFYSCNCYPKCKYLVKYLPIAKACPKCAWPILTIKTTKKSGEQEVCPQKHCGYIEGNE